MAKGKNTYPTVVKNPTGANKSMNAPAVVSRNPTAIKQGLNKATVDIKVKCH